MTAQNLEATVWTHLHLEWNDYLRRRDRFLRAPSRKSVHRLRTAIRRLSIAISLAEGGNSRSRFEQLIGRELKLLGPLRDVQVLRKTMWSRQGQLKVKALEKDLRSKEEEGVRKARQRIGGWRLAPHRRCIEDLDRRLTEPPYRLEGEARAARTSRLKRLSSAVSEGVRALEADRRRLRPEDETSFHAFRIDARNLNYRLEILRGALASPPSLKVRLESLQRRLGKLQDEATLLHLAKGCFRKSKQHPHPRRDFRTELIRARARFIRETRPLRPGPGPRR